MTMIYIDLHSCRSAAAESTELIMALSVGPGGAVGWLAIHVLWLMDLAVFLLLVDYSSPSSCPLTPSSSPY